MENYGTFGQTGNENIIRRIRLPCWITKATHIHPEYVILIAFPLPQLLHEHSLMLRYAYTACLVGTYEHLLSWVFVFMR